MKLDTINNWNARVDYLSREIKNTLEQDISNIYTSILNFIYLNEYRGGCHDTSAAMYILFQESGVNAELFIGQVRTEIEAGTAYFDHSWVKVNDRIYDAALCMPLYGGSVHSPVYASVDLDTGDISRLHYGEPSPHDYDDLTKPIIKQNLSDYAKKTVTYGV